MFEMFKDQNDGLLTERIPIKKLRRKTRINKLQNREENMSQNLKKNEETVLLILKSLSEEEIGLMTEKNQLLDMEEILKKRIVNEIETKKSRIMDLQMEIPKIKQRIEDLATILEIPVVK